MSGPGDIGSVREVGRFLVRSPLGSGGFGHVFRAYDPLLERDVALKRIHRAHGDEPRHGALREARALSSLRHPNIAFVHDVIDIGGDTWIVEEFIEGTTLRERIRSGIDAASFQSLADDCAAALECLAEHGIVHCDVKPENVIVSRKGRAKIVDFGLVRRFDEATTSTTSGSDSSDDFSADVQPARAAGTPSYMAPEVVSGHPPTPRSDLFSLGVVYYEMLTKQNPFRRSSVQATLRSVRDEEPPDLRRILPRVSPRLSRLVHDLLRKDPIERPASAAIVRERLRAANARTRFAPASAAALITASLLAVPSILPKKTEEYLLVEPFEDLSEGGLSRSLALGFTEAIRVEIAGSGGLYVVEANGDPGTGLALRGALQRVGNDLRVTYSLVDRRLDRVLEGDAVEGPANRLFQLQNEVARRVGAMLAENYGVELREPTTRFASKSSTAYEIYLSARGKLASRQDAQEIDDAIRDFEQALALDGDFEPARAGLAEALWVRWEATKDPATVERAQEVALESVRRAPTLSDAHVSLGSILLGSGRAAAAEREFERAAELAPTSVAAYRGLARARAALDDPQGADDAFREAIMARPDDWLVLSSYGAHLAKTGRLHESTLVFERVTRLYPRNAVGLSSYAGVLLLAGRRADAINASRRSIEIRPTYAGYSNLGLGLLGEGRYEESAQAIRSALDLNDRDFRLWANLTAALGQIPGRGQEEMDACRKAKACGEETLSVNPNNAELLSKLAQLESRCGDAEHAIRYADRALAETGHDVRVLLDVAVALATVDEVERACATLQAAFDRGLDPEVVRNDPSIERLKTLDCAKKRLTPSIGPVGAKED